ncbi:hypothetical protein F4823DRAFT_565263 [Ustulina deusta]|nr:hypothetical protein F4823DRAFT_565263 [Ustulina deusta]
MILKYGDADAARPVPIREKPFVAFHSPDNGPLGDLSAAGTDAGGVRTIDGMLTTLSIERVPQTAPDRRVSRFRDVADIRDRMGPFSYTVGSQALKRHGNSDIEDKRILAYAAT